MAPNLKNCELTGQIVQGWGLPYKLFSRQSQIRDVEFEPVDPFDEKLDVMLLLFVFGRVASHPSVYVGEHFNGIEVGTGGRPPYQSVVVFVFEPFECLSVLSADGFLSDCGVSQGHAIRAMAEEFHDGNQTHSGVEQGCRIGVTQSMGGDFSVGIETFTGI